MDSLSMSMLIRFFLCRENIYRKNNSKTNTIQTKYCLIMHAQIVKSAHLTDSQVLQVLVC